VSAESFSSFPEQREAKRLLRAALADGLAHAYLFHGPPGVGKRRAAYELAAEVLGDRGRVERRSHPDLYVLEPLGDQIRIDPIRELRRDLHMRPFEGDRRVYLILGAHLMNEEAADALLKDLEEPPAYAVIVLVADELGPLPETIHSRCQLVPFRRLSERAIRAEVEARAPSLSTEEATAFARIASGRLDRVDRLLDPKAAARREALLEVARAVYADPGFQPADAAKVLLDGARERAGTARKAAEKELEQLDLPQREAEQRVRRAARGAEREEILLALDELAAWYRDLVVVAAGAPEVVVHADRLAELREDGTVERMRGAEAAAERVRETWRLFEELQLQAGLALEALFVRLRRELSPAGAASHA
jgi:DNA polymerase III subunit delta'